MGVQQRFDGARFIVAACDGTEQNVVSVPVGGLVEVLDEFGVEGVTDVHDHADESTAATGQRTGRPIRAITQAGGGGGDALTGRRARPGDAAQD